MKKKLLINISRIIAFAGIFFLGIINSYGQVRVPFTERAEATTNVKGNMTFVSNNILNRNNGSGGPNDAFNHPTAGNNGMQRNYIDIDTDASTFSSSSADLQISVCSRVVYAGLYWAGNYNRSSSNKSFTDIKFSVQGGPYVDLVADNAADPVGEEDAIVYEEYNFKDSPYVCYKNVTNLILDPANPNGTYMAANIRATEGTSVGGAAGWTMVVIYEDPTLPGRFFTVFDGYSGIITGAPPVPYDVSGFTTVPAGPVRAILGTAVLEGDRNISGDSFQFSSLSNAGFTTLGTTPADNDPNPRDNFFDSNITIDNIDILTRNPASTNTLGYDSDIFALNNPGNSVIGNNETAGTFRLNTSGDSFGAFLSVFAVEVIEPEILLVKTVEDGSGTDIGGSDVVLGQEIEYVIAFQNIGNDDAINFTIRDDLPANVDFTDIAANLTLPSGVTYVYDAATHSILFTIPNGLVVENIPSPLEIRFSVNVVNSCFELRDACSNIINNQAFSTYRGLSNPNVISDDPSFYGVNNCGFGEVGPTNFLTDIDDCDFIRDEVFCGTSIILTAGSGFTDYLWYDAAVGGSVIGNTQSITVTSLGSYRVEKTAPAPCLSFEEIVNVIAFTNSLANPVVTGINGGSINGIVENCSNDGEDFPKIFLCGLNDNALIDTDINIDTSNGESIIWEILDTASCTDPGSINDSCPNNSSSCTWNQVHVGNDYIADTEGEFRLTVTYQNGCFRRFYFDVYQNLLNPLIVPNDIICNTDGNITIDSPSASSGYEFQLVNNTTGVAVGAYQSGNSFTITTAEEYVINIRQTLITGGCIFQSDPVEIRERVPTITPNVDNPLCATDLGSVTIQLNDVEPDYVFTIINRDTGNIVQTAPAQTVNFREFTGLAEGNYTGRIQTSPDGCDFSVNFEIVVESDLAATAAATSQITCTDGEITVTATGGIAPFNYSIDGGLNYQTGNTFPITTPGTYDIQVIDFNNCVVIASADVIELLDPVFTVVPNPETCAGANDGSIVITVTNANGYTLQFNNDGGTFQGGTTFTGLSAGDHDIIVRATFDGENCDFPVTRNIIAATPMSGSAALTQQLACPAQLGIITFSGATGGSGSFEYSVDGGANYQAGTVFSNLSNGVYSPVIRDLNNITCTFPIADIDIDALDPPTDLGFGGTVPVCPALTSDVTATATGGTGVLRYEITAPAVAVVTNTTGLFPGLTSNTTYTFLVTDENDCFYTENYTVPPITPISVLGALVSNVVCVGQSNGAVDYTVSGFGGNYSYDVVGLVSGSVETNTGVSGAAINVTGLAADSYTITVTDDTTNCTDTDTVIVLEPGTALDLPTPTLTNISCSALGFIPGAVTSTATDGWGGYIYELEDGVGTVLQGPQGSGTFGTLAAGSYVLVVRDALGCEEREPFTLADPGSPVLALSPNIPCYTVATPVTITSAITSGGTAPFSYELSTGTTNATGSFPGITPGTYTVTVTDNNGCEDTETITINPELTVTATADDFSVCDTSTDITITAGGGDLTYTYAVMADGVPPAGFSATNPVTVPVIGDYDVWVQDGTGCQSMFDLNIGQDPPIVFNAPALSHVLCNGNTTGVIDFTGVASGGQAPYEFSIDGGATFDPALIYNSLAAGTYNIEVRDAEGCIEASTAIITEPAALSATSSVTTPYICGQEAIITVDNQLGGSGTYQYSINGSTWEPAAGTAAVAYPFVNTFTDGTYTIQVRDFNIQTCVFTIIPNLVINPLPTEPVLTPAVTYNCDGSGEITVTPVPAGIYTYQLEDLTNVAIPGYDFATQAASNVFAGVPVGTYIINVNYGPNCFTTTGVTVDPGNEFRAQITGSNNISCNGLTNGDITFEVENFGLTNGFEYSLDNFATAALGVSTISPVTIPTLGAGNYTITVRDVDNPIAGCTVALPETLTEPAVLDVTASVTTALTCTNGGAIITALAVDGTGPYIYQLEDTVLPIPGVIVGYDFVTQGSNAVFTGVPAGNYVVRVQDDQTCEDITTTITVAATNAVTFTAVASPACYAGDSNAQITVDVLTGNNDYLVSINSGPFTAPNTTLVQQVYTGLTSGTYTIDVMDGFGCPAVQQSITINPQILASVVLDSDLICTVNAQATITPSGGSGTYTTFEWSNDGGTTYNSTNFVGNVFTIGVAATYEFRVTDDAGCEAETTSIVVTPAIQPSFTAVQVPILCNGDSTGELTVVINTTIGVAPYTTEVFVDTGGGVTGASFGTQTTNLAAGDYVVRVTDSKSCSTDVLETITESPLISPNIGSTNIQCTVTGTVLGTITVDASGGTGINTYIYEVFNADFSVSLTYDTTAAGPVPNSNTFTNLNFGDYIVRVVDGNSCPIETPITITTGPDVLIATQGAAGCLPGSGEMTVQAQASNGTLGVGSFFFSTYPSAIPFPGFADGVNWFAEDLPSPPALVNSHTFTNLTPGVTYTFIVHDTDTNCEYIQTATVPVSAVSTLVSTVDAVTNVACTGAADGSVDFTISGYGGTDVNYEVLTLNTNLALGPPNTGTISGAVGGPETGTATNIPPGNYYILFEEVTSGCVIASAPFTIEQAPALLVLDIPTTSNDDVCSIAPNDTGSITTVAHNGAPPYQFQLELAANPAPTSLTWAGVNTTGFFGNIAGGNYVVYVKDANDCIQSQPATVNENPAPVIAASIVDNCVAEGSFEILVTRTPSAPIDSPAPYTMSVDGAAAQTVIFTANVFTITGLNSGVHSVEVFDANGCSLPATSVTINVPMQFTADLITLLDCELPAPNDNAEIEINVSGGSGTYQYEITGPGTDEGGPGPGTVLPGNPYTYSGATTLGTYTITIYDIGTPNTCPLVRTVEVPARLEPVITIESFTDVTCEGDDDGTIVVSVVDNGTGPYIFAITAPAAAVPFSTTGTTATFTGLDGTGGITYTIEVSSANSCTDTDTQLISEPATIVVPAPTLTQFLCTTGNAMNTALIDVNGVITGGSGTYVRYEFIDPSTAVVQDGTSSDYIVSDVAGGTYTINVYDTNGCIGTTTAVINPFTEISSPIVTVDTPISCTLGENITVSVTTNPVAPVTPPILSFTVTGLDNAFPATTNGTGAFTGLPIGNFSVDVTNANTGCVVSTTHEVIDPDDFDITVNNVNDVVCFGANDGVVNFTLTDPSIPLYVGGITYEVFDVATNSTQTAGPQPFGTPGPTANVNLAAGDYYVDIIQAIAPNCTTTKTFSIAGPPAVLNAGVSVTAVTCNLNDGIIEIINPVGGWGGYTYYVGVGSPVNLAAYSANPEFTLLAGGVFTGLGTDYEVWIADLNGCESQILPNQNLIDPTPITGTLQVNQFNCNATDGIIEVPVVAGGQGSNYSYQLQDGLGANIGGLQATAVFNNLGAGTYQVLITDQWDCSLTTNQVVLYEVLNASTGITANLTCNRNDGEITVTVTSGGSGNFLFDTTTPISATALSNITGVFTGLDEAGTYTIIVTDLNTTVPGPACTITVTGIIVEPTVPVIDTVVPTEVSCIGSNDGTVTITLTDATDNDPAYIYSIITGPSTPPDNNNGVFTGLLAGAYTYTVTSSLDCVVAAGFTIGAPPAFSATAAVTQEFACDVTNSVALGEITVTVDAISTGTPPYLYSIDGTNFLDNGGVFDIVDTGVDQALTFTVRDGRNCTFPVNQTITTLPTITAVAVTQDTAITCTNDEVVDVTVTGGSGEYSFELLPPGSQAIQTPLAGTFVAQFTLTTPGDYTFLITDINTGCTFLTTPYTIAPYDVIEVVAANTTPITCYTVTDGTLQITVNNYVGAYTYDVLDDTNTVVLGYDDIVANTAGNPLTIGGLGGGNYTVEVTATGSPFCDTVSNAVNIDSPNSELIIGINIDNDITCLFNDGILTAVASGGWDTSYMYTLTYPNLATVGPQASATFSGLDQDGLYIISVEDAGGCIVQNTENLTVPTIIIATAVQTEPILCHGDDSAEITVTASGGRGAAFYQYILTNTITGEVNAAVGSNVLTGLVEGTYTVTVVDGWGCDITTLPVIITEPTELVASLIQTSPLTCLTQAEIQVSATGGVGPYLFSTSETGPFLATDTFSVGIGQYQYYAQDFNLCVSLISNRVTILEIPPLTVVTDDSGAFLSCFGDSDAVIRAEAHGGLGGYMFELYDVNPLPINSPVTPPIRVAQAVPMFDNLGAGTYYVRVTSDDCVVVSLSVSITEPLPLVIDREEPTNPSCAGEDDGQIIFEVSGGTGIIKYAITPNLEQFDEQSTFTDLSPGIYEVIAQDEQGCYILREFEIIDPDPIELFEGTLIQEFCVGDLTGAIEVVITGGTPPYTAAITYPGDPSAFVYEPVAVDVHTFDTLAGGITYTILVEDDNECRSSIEITLGTPVNLTSETLVEYGCFENRSTNSVTVIHEDPTVINRDVIYVLDGTGAAQLDNVFENLTPGDHFIEMSLDGCVRETLPFEILFVEDLTFTFIDGTINQILFEPAGGVPPYEYFIDGTTTIDETSYYINHTDTYTITVIDSRGCTYRDNIYIEFIDIDLPPVFTPNGDGNQDEWQVINDEGFPNIVTKVYDRYGRWLGTLNQGDTWKGIYNGNALPTGDYWYVLKINGENDPREFVGHFTLYR